LAILCHIVDFDKITLDFSLYTFYILELLPHLLKLPTPHQAEREEEGFLEAVEYYVVELPMKMKIEK
jgi:hypothetical protein